MIISMQGKDKRYFIDTDNCDPYEKAHAWNKNGFKIVGYKFKDKHNLFDSFEGFLKLKAVQFDRTQYWNQKVVVGFCNVTNDFGVLSTDLNLWNEYDKKLNSIRLNNGDRLNIYEMITQCKILQLNTKIISLGEINEELSKFYISIDPLNRLHISKYRMHLEKNYEFIVRYISHMKYFKGVTV